MQRSHVLNSALVGFGLVGLAASQASAVTTLYSTGFEQSAGWTVGSSLVGQPTSAAATERWTGFSSIGGGGTTAPVSGVFAYTPATPALGQYALLQATNNFAGSSGFFLPKHNLPVADGGTGAFVPGVTNSDKQVAIFFNLNVLSGPTGTTAANDEFFGVVANTGTLAAPVEISLLGLNNRTGAYVLPAGATVINSSPFGAGVGNLNVNHGYQLLLDYTTSKWSVYSQFTSGVSPYVLDATGSFENAASSFTDADLAAYNLGAGASNGNAIFDDYRVQSVPEPTVLAVSASACGLLLTRRRRMV